MASSTVPPRARRPRRPVDRRRLLARPGAGAGGVARGRAGRAPGRAAAGRCATRATSSRRGAGGPIARGRARSTSSRWPPPSRRSPTPSSPTVGGGAVALVLGGDCTVGVGTVLGARRTGPVALLYLDQHPDLNTPASVPTGTLDWMGVAHLLGEAGTEPAVLGARAAARVRATSSTSASTPSTPRRTSAPAWTRSAWPAVPRRRARRRSRGRRRARRSSSSRPAAERLVVHFDVDVVEFTDAPLSENVGRGEGVPLDAALAAFAVLVARPAPGGRHADRAQPPARRGGRGQPASPRRRPRAPRSARPSPHSPRAAGGGDASGGNRTHTGCRPAVFETAASTVPPRSRGRPAWQRCTAGAGLCVCALHTACIGSILPRSSSRRAARRLGRGRRGAPCRRGRVHHERRGMKIWWKRLLPLMLIAVVALVAACGDDDEGDATSAAESAAAEVSSAAESAGSEAESAARAWRPRPRAPLRGDRRGGIVRGGTDRRQLQGRQRPAAAGCLGRPVQDARAGHAALPGAAGRRGRQLHRRRTSRSTTRPPRRRSGIRPPARPTPSAYAARRKIIGVIGTFNSGCAELEIPILNQANVAMVSPANTGVGLTHVGPGSEAGEPEQLLPDRQAQLHARRPVGRLPGCGRRAAHAGAGREVGLHPERQGDLREGRRRRHRLGRREARHHRARQRGLRPEGAELRRALRADQGQNPDAIFIGAIIDYNGGQLVKDKVKILGDNNTVKLIGPDGMLVNDLPTDEQAGASAEGMYLTFAGLGPDQIKERGGAAAEFLTAYEAEYGKPEVYTVYGAAAMQAMLKAIGPPTARARASSSSCSRSTIPKEESLLGEGYKFDENGDTTLKDMSIFRVTGTDIPFERRSRSTRRCSRPSRSEREHVRAPRARRARAAGASRPPTPRMAAIEARPAFVSRLTPANLVAIGLLVALGVLAAVELHRQPGAVRPGVDHRAHERRHLRADRARLHARLRHHRADQLRPRRPVHAGLRVRHAPAEPVARRRPTRRSRRWLVLVARDGRHDGVLRDDQRGDRARRLPAAAARAEARAADHGHRHVVHPAEHRPALERRGPGRHPARAARRQRVRDRRRARLVAVHHRRRGHRSRCCSC